MAANMWKMMMMVALIMTGCGLQACNGMNVGKSNPTMFKGFACFRRCSITCSVNQNQNQNQNKNRCYKKCLKKCGLVWVSKPKSSSSPPPTS
ncbi:unnamed protein product [Arabidopsis halleri]